MNFFRSAAFLKFRTSGWLWIGVVWALLLLTDVGLFAYLSPQELVARKAETFPDTFAIFAIILIPFAIMNNIGRRISGGVYTSIWLAGYSRWDLAVFLFTEIFRKAIIAFTIAFVIGFFIKVVPHYWRPEINLANLLVILYLYAALLFRCLFISVLVLPVVLLTQGRLAILAAFVFFVAWVLLEGFLKDWLGDDVAAFFPLRSGNGLGKVNLQELNFVAFCFYFTLLMGINAMLAKRAVRIKE